MTINLETTKEGIFKKYLTIINPLLKDKKLTGNEIEVLSRLLLVDFMYKHIAEADRQLLIFHTKTRSRILLDISSTIPTFSKAVFHNTITTLKKKGIIKGGKRALELNFANPLSNLPSGSKSLAITFNLKTKDGQELV